MALENIIRFSTASPDCQDVTRKVSRVSLQLKNIRKHATRSGGRPAARKVQVENEPGMGRPSTADHKERLQEHSLVLDVAHGGVNEAGTAVAAVKPGEALIGGSEASREQEAATRSGTPGNGEKRVLSPDPDRNPTPEFVPEDWWIELACDFWQVDEKELLRIIGRERHEGATDEKVTDDQVSQGSLAPMATADLNVLASEERSSFHNQGLIARPRRRVGGKLIPNIHEFDRLPTIAEETGFVPEDWWVELACEFWQVDEDEVMRIVRGMGCDVADDKAADPEASGDFIPPIRDVDLNGAANESEKSCQNQTPPSRTRRRVGGKLVPNIHEFDRLSTIPEEPSETPETGNRNGKPNKKAKAKRNKTSKYSNASGNEDVSCDKEAIARTDQQGCGSAMEALPRKPMRTAASDLCGPGEAVVGDKTGEAREMGGGGSGGSRDEAREHRVSPVASDSFQTTEKSRMINGKAKTTKKTVTRRDQGKRVAQSEAALSRTSGRQSPVSSGDTTTRLPSLTNPGPTNTREKSQHFTRGMLKVCDSTSSQNFTSPSASSNEGGSELRLPRLDATPGCEVQLTFQPKPPPRPAPKERTNPRARRILKFAEPSAPEQQSVKEVELTERVGGNWPRPPGVSSSDGSGASPTKPGLLPELPRRGGQHVSACATEKISDCSAPKSAERKLSVENVRRFAREADHENRCARPLQQPRASEENLPHPPAVPRCPTEKSRSRLNAVRKAGEVKVLQDEADKQNREVFCY